VVPYGLTREDFERLLVTIPTIERALPIREIRHRFASGGNLMEGRLVGCTPEYAEVNRLEVDRGRFLSDTEVREKVNHCVLASGVAERLFPIENPVGRPVQLEDKYYRATTRRTPVLNIHRQVYKNILIYMETFNPISQTGRNFTIEKFDEKGKLTFLNRVGFTSTGYSEKEIRDGLSAFQMLPPEDAKRARENMTRILNGHSLGPSEYTILRKDGSTFPVQLMSDVVKDSEGEVFAVITTCEDITERRKYERGKNEGCVHWAHLSCSPRAADGARGVMPIFHVRRVRSARYS
jgi:PAS domain S-box-containing protein